MVGWHPQLNGHEFEQTLEDDEEQGSLACSSPWGGKESDMAGSIKTKSLGFFFCLFVCLF